MYNQNTIGFIQDEDVTIISPAPKPDPADIKIGSLLLNRYRVLEQLGRGGMGVVYKCFDQVAEVEVAIKTLAPELSGNTSEMENVRKNFQLVHNLRHPNIAGYDALELDENSGIYYLIMEFVDGQALRYHIRNLKAQGDFSITRIKKIFIQIADALDHAHGKMILHRDIKPGNIMIDREGNVKLLDFGLAAQIHTSLSKVSMHTADTSGTIPYMSPEQWRGRQLNPSSDQYSLAVTLYEILAGYLPFDNPDKDIMRSCVLNDQPQPLAVPEWAAISKAMSKNPDDRFNSCREFVFALHNPASQPPMEPQTEFCPSQEPEPPVQTFQPNMPESEAASQPLVQLEITPNANNVFVLRGNINLAQDLIVQAIFNLNMNITYRNAQCITCRASYYLINAILVSAFFTQEQDCTRLSFTANLQSGFDVHKACINKINDIASRFVAIASSRGDCRITTTVNTRNAELKVWAIRSGEFLLQGNIELAQHTLLKAMSDCSATIQSTDSYNIFCKMPYGISGINVKAIFRKDVHYVTLSLLVVNDIWGICNQKKQLLSDRFYALCCEASNIETHNS